MKKIILIFLMILFLSIPSFAKTKKYYTTLWLNVYIYKVIDGDTIWAWYGNLPLKIRLLGIDTFETHKNKHEKLQEKKFNLTWNQIQELGLEAKEYMMQYEDSEVCLKLNTHNLLGFYGRYLGIIYPKPCLYVDNSTKSINQILLDKNLAVILK